ncbi:hypothetical protein LINGRAHAP2_LOCUS10020 [Linum grandiflorum]
MQHTYSLLPPTMMQSPASRSSRQRHWPYRKNGNDVERHKSTPVMKR